MCGVSSLKHRQTSFWVSGICLLLLAAVGIVGPSPVLMIMAILAGGCVVLWLGQRRLLLPVLVSACPFFSRVQYDIGGVSVRPEMLVGFVCWLAFIGAVLAGGVRFSRAQVTVVMFITLWLSALVLTAVLVSPRPADSLRIVLWLALGLGIAAWLAVDKARAMQVVQISVVLALIYALLGTGLWALSLDGWSSWGLQLDPAYGGYAAYVTVLEANIYASLVVVWAVIAATPWASKVPTAVRFALVFSAPIAAIAAHTRAALVAWAVGILMIAISRGRKSNIAKLTIVVGGIVGTALLLTVDLTALGIGKFTELTDFSSGTGGYRVRTWEVAFADLTSSGQWISGLGPNTFGMRHLDPSKPLAAEEWYLGNVFLQVLHDSGLVGVLALSGALAAVFIARPSWAALAVVVSYAIMGALTSVIWLSQTWILVGLALAFVGVAARGASNRANRHGSGRVNSDA